MESKDTDLSKADYLILFKSALETGNRHDIVDFLINKYNPNESDIINLLSYNNMKIEIVEKLLRKVNLSDMNEENLYCILEKLFSHYGMAAVKLCSIDFHKLNKKIKMMLCNKALMFNDLEFMKKIVEDSDTISNTSSTQEISDSEFNNLDEHKEESIDLE